MTKQLTKQTIGVGVAGTGFIVPAHVEGLHRCCSERSEEPRWFELVAQTTRDPSSSAQGDK